MWFQNHRTAVKKSESRITPKFPRISLKKVPKIRKKSPDANLENISITCLKCNREFSKKQAFRDHIRRVKSCNSPPYVCSINDCLQEFQDRKEIITHINNMHKVMVSIKTDDIKKEIIEDEEMLGQDEDESEEESEIEETNEKHESDDYLSDDNAKENSEDGDDEEDTDELTKDESEELNMMEDSETEIQVEKVDKVTEVPKAGQVWDDVDVEFLYELDNMKFPDMKIECLGRTVNCHRVYLCQKSPIFDKIIDDDSFNETRIFEVAEKDLKCTIEVLRFIYKDFIKDTIQGYRGAYLYRVQAMMDMYEKSLFKILSIDNITDFYQIEPKNDKLKLHLKVYTKEHLEEILASNKWKKLSPKFQAKIIKSLYNSEMK